MTTYETLSLLTSLLAIVVAAYALFRTHRIGLSQLDLQSKQAKLAEYQHKLLVREQEVRAKADLRASYVPYGRNGHKLMLINVGGVSARNIRIADLEGNPHPEPLIRSEAEAIFPVAELRAGESVTVIAAIVMETVLPTPLIVTWDDDVGRDQQRELKVQID